MTPNRQRTFLAYAGVARSPRYFASLVPPETNNPLNLISNLIDYRYAGAR